MCGRYVSATSPDDIAAYFDVDMVAETLTASAASEPRFNVAPTDPVAVVREHDDQRQLDAFTWGLVPFWAKDAKIGPKMINARAETVREKGSFKHAFKKRRCIIPADGFYEWTTIPLPPGKKGKPKKQPWHLSTTDGSVMAFAGLYEYWRPDEDADPLLSCTIITTSANEAIAPIHDRMPVLLQPENWDLWLSPDYRDEDHLEAMLTTAPSELFEIFAVGTDVNNSRNEGAYLRDRVDPDANGDTQGVLL